MSGILVAVRMRVGNEGNADGGFGDSECEALADECGEGGAAEGR